MAGADGLPLAPADEAATETAAGPTSTIQRSVSKLESTKARLAITVAALAFYAVFIFRTSFSVGGTRYFVLFEDAMISMRYARHLAEGSGLVWNRGEPPIEGFTNLLWVLWMSVAHLLGLSESKISLFIMLTGVAIMTATGFVASKIARRVAPPEASSAWVPIAVLAATLFDYPLVFWTLRGMEVGALTLFVYALLWLALEQEEKWSFGRTIAMALVTVAALLIRSDSVVPVGLICLYAFLFCEKRWLFAAVVGAFAGAAVGGQTLFRKHYFHESLPNTYFLKLYHIPLSARVKRGAFVALEVLTMHLAVPASVVLASVLGPKKDFWKDKATRRLVLLGVLFTAQVGYATYVGGDAWEWMLYANRYMCVGMPALIVLVTVLLDRLVRAGAARRAEVARRFSWALVASGLVLLALNLYAKKFPEPGIAATITFSKKAFAVGGGLVFLGLVLRMKDLREGLAEGLVAMRARLGSRATVVSSALILTALVWLPAHLLPLGQWAAQNAAQYKDEAKYTRLGLLIAATTPPDLRMAVAAAGATPYFSQRPTEDLLGKNDRHVAKLAPRGVFSPGHDKWDYEYSLGERKSDLIVETVDVSPADEAYIASLGFEKLPNDMRLRRDAPVARRDLIGLPMDDANALAPALAQAGFRLPAPLRGVDVAMVLAFGLVVTALGRAIVKDAESFDGLPPAPPVEEEADEGAKAALAGANARAIPVLDGMRGIAVILVLLFHFAWTFPGDDVTAAHGAVEKIAARVHAFFWSGWTGVDLFFVLSGYLITRGLVTPSEKPLGTRMKSFWMRRVLRIFPLYYAVTVVGSIVALAIGGYVPSLPYWLYMQNYALAFDPPEQVLKWVAHFWSLAIEEQFYFVWPIVALVVSRRRLIAAILALVSFVVVVRAGFVFKALSVPQLAHLFGTQDYVNKFVYRATFTRADGLLLGAFVAVTQREALHPVAKIWRRVRFPAFVATALVLAGLYAVANGLNDYDRRVMSVGYFALALFFASAVSMCADGKIGDRARAVLQSRPLVACGKVSYGMYIFHWPLVVVLVPWITKVQAGMSVPMQIALNGAVIAGGIGVIYVLAEISFRLFETRFLDLKKKFHD
jgi:peptidoglycan/LPS O-acetylase OafA/YrhL